MELSAKLTEGLLNSTNSDNSISFKVINNPSVTAEPSTSLNIKIPNYIVTSKEV